MIIQITSTNHSRLLDVGTMTNKGVITKIIYDIHTRYNTDTGSYMPEELAIEERRTSLAIRDLLASDPSFLYELGIDCDRPSDKADVWPYVDRGLIWIVTAGLIAAAIILIIHLISI